MLVLCVALVVVDMAARASSAGSLLRAVPRTPRPAPAPAPTEWPHHHQQGHGQTLLPVGDVPPLGPRTPDHGQSTDWAAGGPQHTQALSCNASRGAVTNLCWDGPSIRAQPGGASGSWFFPNVTSFNCSYTVPDTPAVYGPHSIFLWCGLQPGGGFGVIQPQIMYGPDCPEGFNRSRVGPFTNHTCDDQAWCSGIKYEGDIGYDSAPYWYWSAQYVSSNDTEKGKWVCGTGELYKATAGQRLETRMWYDPGTDSFHSLMISPDTGEQSYFNASCPDYDCNLSWRDLIFSRWNSTTKKADGGKNMVLFVAETYRLDEVGALSKLPADASDWVVNATLGVDNGDGKGEVAVALGSSWVDETRGQVVNGKRRVRIDEDGTLHLDLHTHSRNRSDVGARLGVDQRIHEQPRPRGRNPGTRRLPKASFASVPVAVSCQNTSSALADRTVARLGELPFVVIGPAHEQSLRFDHVMTAAAEQAAAIRGASNVGTQVYFQISPSKLLPFWEVGRWFAGQEQWLLRDDSGHVVAQLLSPKFHDARNVTFVDFSQQAAQDAWVAAWYSWFQNSSFDGYLLDANHFDRQMVDDPAGPMPLHHVSSVAKRQAYLAGLNTSQLRLGAMLQQAGGALIANGIHKAGDNGMLMEEWGEEHSYLHRAKGCGSTTSPLVCDMQILQNFSRDGGLALVHTAAPFARDKHTMSADGVLKLAAFLWAAGSRSFYGDAPPLPGEKAHWSCDEWMNGLGFTEFKKRLGMPRGEGVADALNRTYTRTFAGGASVRIQLLAQAYNSRTSVACIKWADGTFSGGC